MASPKLRFKEFDGDWIKVDIQTLVDEKIIDKPMDGNHGEIHPVSADYVENGIPFVMATDVIDGKVHLEKSKKIRKSQADSLRKGFSIEEDILLTHKATIGNVAKVPELETPYVMLTPQVTYYRVLNKDKLVPDFIKSTFEAPIFQNELLALCTGATRLYIGISEQRKLPFSYPSKEEQTKIASFLSAVDEKTSQLTHKHELLSLYKQGMMKKLFSQQIRFKADDGSEFGKWEVKQLLEIADVKGGKRLPKGYSLVNENTGHPYITVSDMNRSYGVDLENIRYVPLDAIGTISRYTITDKDIFISVAGTLGIIGKIPSYLNGANLTENADKLTNLKCHQDFLIYLLDSGVLSGLIESTATTSAQPKLALYAIEQMEIIVPCLEEQTKIANFLFAIDQKIEKVAQQIEETKQWKKGLLQQMFV
ncbi:restriction endonuclease subunit S [Acinetobacter bereziniae]|uniref:restriction endonuclease subunit S n=2 Tax=Acinetobacter bereziniae TaxID=106648 RepID=UPI00124FAF96|nr:restriction endonuclease subunit S [Acinetobacter bereziniae]MDG3556306.1 restriction endonuclease subunit S [Acinetobacter bereziniae]MDP6002953.1 restriction endonuclease subunit S [Acinetobacter bereziniae]QQC79658.1 restriction endonuclease subunit S [Acinetobacter bereziniae]UUN92740.1 restriction endonuclease subunit S [Acinetobacter bereziniae]WMW73805.1 restriction endonuclease subunit S [Acinetobacter bereziniae]